VQWVHSEWEHFIDTNRTRPIQTMHILHIELKLSLCAHVTRTKDAFYSLGQMSNVEHSAWNYPNAQKKHRLHHKIDDRESGGKCVCVWADKMCVSVGVKTIYMCSRAWNRQFLRHDDVQPTKRPAVWHTHTLRVINKGKVKLRVHTHTDGHKTHTHTHFTHMYYPGGHYHLAEWMHSCGWMWVFGICDDVHTTVWMDEWHTNQFVELLSK
jgi:hypothetical protein